MTVLLYISGFKHAGLLTDRSQTFKPKTRAVFLKVNSYHTAKLDCIFASPFMVKIENNNKHEDYL